MNPFAALGLSADADEAQIKRAYAKLLRSHRPDDDPAGFQRLNEAYRQCLDWAQRRAAAAMAVATDEGEDEDEDETEDDGELAQRLRMPPAPRPPPIPAAPRMPFAAATPPAPAAPRAASAPAAPRAPAGSAPEPVPAPMDLAPSAAAWRGADFDARRFLDELYRRAETHTVIDLERWLAEHPALYEFERKQALAPTLVAYLGTREPLYLSLLDALLRFFGLDSVHAHSAGLQTRIVELRARARRSGADLSEVRFGSQRGRRDPGLFPEGGLSLRTVIFLMLSLAVIGAMAQFLFGPSTP